MADNPSTTNVGLNFGLGTQPGNAGIRVGVMTGADTGGATFYIDLEDGSGVVALEDNSGNILLEIAP